MDWEEDLVKKYGKSEEFIKTHMVLFRQYSKEMAITSSICPVMLHVSDQQQPVEKVRASVIHVSLCDEHVQDKIEIVTTLAATRSIPMLGWLECPCHRLHALLCRAKQARARGQGVKWIARVPRAATRHLSRAVKSSGCHCCGPVILLHYTSA